MNKKKQIPGLILSVIGLAMIVLAVFGYVYYGGTYEKMYTTRRYDVNTILRHKYEKWNESALLNGVNHTITPVKEGITKQKFAADDYYIASQPVAGEMNFKDAESKVVVDKDGEFTVFVIGNSKIFAYNDADTEETRLARSVEGYYTIPSTQELADMGITLTLVKPEEARATSPSRDGAVTLGQPSKMKLSAKSFEVMVDPEKCDLKVNLDVTAGFILQSASGVIDIYAVGDRVRVDKDALGTPVAISDDASRFVVAEGVEVRLCEQASEFEQFTMLFRMQFAAFGVLFLATGLILAFCYENPTAMYIMKRFWQSIMTIMLIVCVVFLLLRLLPKENFIPPDQIEKMKEWQKQDYLKANGYMDPWYEQLGRFLRDALLYFDLGNSMRYNTSKTVAECIGDAAGISLKLGMTSLVIALFVGVILGIFQARFKDKLFDKIGTGFTIFVNAVPALVSYSIIWALCTKAFGLPSQYSKDNWLSCIGPVACLSLGSIASYMLWMRRYMVDELNKDYIRLAKLKGLNSTDVMFKHVMRNAFLPLAQYLPYNILLTVGGSLLMESFFAVNGLGPMLTQAIGKYDVNLVQALVMFYAALGVFGLFLGDLFLTLLDPRITLTGKGESR